MRTATLTRVVLIRPGATEFDDQGRMKGSLDMPLSEAGDEQVEQLVNELAETRLRTMYVSPCESARVTAERIAEGQRRVGQETKIKVIDALTNLDHGLWHGKLIDEVRRNHPRVYRLGAERPEDFCPPEGEPVAEAQARLSKAIKKCLRKNRDEIVGLVIPEPLASIAQCLLKGEELTSLWKSETDEASWALIETEL